MDGALDDIQANIGTIISTAGAVKE